MSKDGLRYENSGIWDGGKQLTTFRAKILKETAIYDRDNCVGRMLTIEARLGETQQTFEIDAAELNRIDWVSKHVGIPDEVCFVSAKEMAKAIISLSKTSKRLVRRFISMGFQAIDGQPVYVHGGGVLMRIRRLTTGTSRFSSTMPSPATGSQTHQQTPGTMPII